MNSNSTLTCDKCKKETNLNITESQLKNNKSIRIKCENCDNEIEVSSDFIQKEIHKQAVDQLKAMYGKNNVIG